MSRRSSRLRVSRCGRAARRSRRRRGALEPREFVAGWPIEVPADAEVFDVALTAEVYAAAESIEQLAVLDADGEPQSFFRRSGGGARRAARRAGGVAAVCRGASKRRLIVGVTRSESSTSVNVAPDGAGAAGHHGIRARCARRRSRADRARARLARAAAAVPARRRRRAEHGPHELAQRRARVRRGACRSAAPRSATRACPFARAPAAIFRITPRGAVADWYLQRATFVIATAEPPTPESARRAAARLRARRPKAPSPTRCISTPAGPLPVSSLALAFGDGRRLGSRRRRREPLARGAMDDGRVRRAVLRARLRGPRVREHAARGRPARGALLARRAGGAPPRDQRARARARVSAGASARRGRRRARRICSRPARWPRRPGPTDARAGVVASSSRRPRSCRRATLGARRELGGAARSSRAGASRGARRRSGPC